MRQAPNNASKSGSGIAATMRGSVAAIVPSRSHKAPRGVVTSVASPASPTQPTTATRVESVVSSVGVGSMGHGHKHADG